MSGIDINDILERYSGLVEDLKVSFPHVDLKILFELLSHRLIQPYHKPVLRLEIFYDEDVDLNKKAEQLSNFTGVVASLYKSEHRLVIEPRLELEELRDIANDADIKSLAGDVLCCLDTLISRRKVTTT